MPELRELEYGDEIRAALEALAVRTGSKYTERGYVVFERYFRGDHPMRYVSKEFAKRFGATLKTLVDNYCPMVVDTLASRLIVDTFTGSQEKTITDFLNKTRFEALQRSVHKDAVLYGDAYVIVWPLFEDGKRSRFYRQRPWNIAPVYDPTEPEKLLCAAKLWPIADKSKRFRLTIYYEDRIERYITGSIDGKGISAATVVDEYEADGEEFLQPHKYGRVPVAHFANGVGLGEFGVSELHDVIPLQAMLNKQVYDLMVGMESASWLQRWASGIEPKIDPATGKPDTSAFVGSRMWTVANAEGKFGQLDGPDPTPIIAAIESTRMEISRIKRIPAYMLGMTGDIPSGAALRVTEAPLTAAVEDRQVHFGNIWEDTLAMALGREDNLTAVWRDTSPVSFSEQLDAGLTMKSLGLPTTYILQRSLGLTPEEAQKLAEERQAEDDAKAETQMRLLTRVPEAP